MSESMQPAFTVDRVLDAPTEGPMFGLVRAFLKPHDEAHFEVVNEFICARLAHALGLSCPPGDFAVASQLGTITWISPQVRSPSPPPVDPDEIAAGAPMFCAGVLAFDAWVLNLDRHEWNIIYGPTIGAWVIDHGQALYYRGDGAAAALAQTREQSLTAHLLLDVVDPVDVQRWCTRISGVSSDLIAETVEKPLRIGLIDDSHATGLVDFLVHRSQEIARLIPGVALPASSSGGEGAA